jgi:RNA polymerase sigma-70 factor (ECF subfamily)
MDMTDEQLLDRFEAGDAAAFGTLLQRYRGPLYNFVARSIRDVDMATDLVQDIFTRVIRRSDGFQRNAKFSTWIYAVARNLCIDHQRRMKHRRHASLDAPSVEHDGPGSAWVEKLANAQPDVESQASAGGLRARIADAVENLPDEQREVFLLRELQQMPFADIAVVVGASENTVKSRMRYALERLQEALADFEEYARVRA